jgi:tRNA(Ile)-lysidine synthase
LRLKIVPEIESGINSDFSRTLFQTSKIVSEFNDFVDRIIDSKFNELVSESLDDLWIDIKSLSKENEFIKTEIIRKIILQKIKIEPTFSKIIEILNMLKNQTGRKVLISDDYQIFRERDTLYLKKVIETNPSELKIKIGKKYPIGNISLRIQRVNRVEFLKKDNSVEFIDADKIKGQIFLRNWQEGDRFVPLGMTKSKKISDFLTDKKVYSSERKNVLTLSDEEKIFYLLNFRIDNRVKISDESKNFYKIEIKNE